MDDVAQTVEGLVAALELFLCFLDCRHHSVAETGTCVYFYDR